MPDIVTTHLTHLVWAFICLAVALAVHFWPPIKAWFAARAAAVAAEEKRAKALLELATCDLEGIYTSIKLDVQSDIAALVKQIKALEARIDAQVAADALKVAAAVDPVPVPAPFPSAPEIVTIPAAPVRSLLPQA